MLINMMETDSKHSIKKIDINNLNTSDVLCPICRTILIEPVSLPCNHVFCKCCFDATMLNANLECPLCRIRVGSWFRRTLKAGKLVNEHLWNAIKRQYAKEVHNKYEGVDNAIEEVNPVIIISRPGEIRKEYENQRRIDEQEQQKLKEAEELASDKLIKELAEAEESKKKANEDRLRLDMELAKKLSEQFMASSYPSSSTSTSRQFLMSNNINNNKKQIGPFQRFLMSKQESLNMNKFTNVLNNSNGGIQNKDNIANKANKTLNGEEKTIKTISLSHLQMYNQTHPQLKRNVKNDRNIIRGYLSTNYREKNDSIDPEYRLYFKPISPNRSCQFIGAPIRKTIKAIHQVNNGIITIIPPNGQKADLSKNRSKSAFVQYINFDKKELTFNCESEIKQDDDLDKQISNTCTPEDKYSDDSFRGFDETERQFATETCNNILEACKQIATTTERLKIQNDLKSKIVKMNDTINIIEISEDESDPEISKFCDKQIDLSSLESVTMKELKVVISPLIESRFKRSQLLNPIEHVVKVPHPILPTKISNSKENSKKIGVSKLKSKCKINKRRPNLQSSTKNSPTRKSKRQLVNNSKIRSSQLTLNFWSAGTNNNCIQNANLPSTFRDDALKKQQEDADFTFAQQLQAQFDSIRLPPQTRQGTKRQNDIRNYLVDKN